MDRRILKTREAIKNAYLSLLLEKKTTKITISEIARKANIDRKTFYLHYQSTNDIIHEYTEKSLQELNNLLEENNFWSEHLDTHAFSKSMNQLLEQDMELHRFLVTLPDFHIFWEEVKNIATPKLMQILSKHLQLSQEESFVHARFWAAGITEIYISWLRNEIPVSLEELEKITSTIVLSHK